MFDYNDFYNRYSSSKKDQREKLLGELKVALYFDYRIFFKADRDTASDFYCVFFKDLKPIVEKFQSTRASFFTYLVSSVRNNFYNFQKKKNLKNKLVKLIEDEVKKSNLVAENFIEQYYKNLLNNMPQTAVAESTIQYGNIRKQKKLKSIINRAYDSSHITSREKRIVEKLLICKHAWNLPEHKIIHLCYVLDLEVISTLEIIAHIRELMEKRLKTQRVLENKINGYFCKKKLSEKLLKDVSPESYDFNFYKSKKQKNEKYLKNSTKKFLQKSMQPSATAISEVLGLSYPTIQRWLKRISLAVKEIEKREKERGKKWQSSIGNGLGNRAIRTMLAD